MSLVSGEFNVETDISYNYDTMLNGLYVPFWSENPNILLQSNQITELFPISEMTFNQKLNAISRSVLLLIIILFILNKNIIIIYVGLITLGAIYMLYYSKKKIQSNKEHNEGFENATLAVLSDEGFDTTDTTDTFDTPSDTNPFSNVLIPDYDFNTDKKPAPPAFNGNIKESILEQAKKLVIDQNLGQPDIADKLFKDLGEQFVFEQSLQPFYSNAATTIPNDQAGFADFCYGSMVSCKEGNKFSCARNLDRHTN
jgi:hypothetical protein